MKAVGLIALLAAVAAPAQAPAPAPPPTMDDSMPPERFWGDTSAVLITTDRAGIDKICGMAEPGYMIVACIRVINGVPVIVMPNPATYAGPHDYRVILAHEQAHVNGWPADHPR